MFILLKKAFQRQQPGAKIDVADADAKTLIEAGIGEERAIQWIRSSRIP